MSAHCCSTAATTIVAGVLPVSLLTLAILGSWHCVGMCGGIVAAVTRSWVDVTAYHLGRLVSYAALGIVAGMAGNAIGQSIRSILPGDIGIWAGAALIVFGIVMALRPAPLSSHWPQIPGLNRLFSLAMRLPRPILSISAGFISAALPCGLLWIAVLAAAATGNPLWGAGAMAVFWAGTVPVFVAFAAVILPIQQRLDRLFPILLGGLWIVIGIATIVWRIRP